MGRCTCTVGQRGNLFLLTQTCEFQVKNTSDKPILPLPPSLLSHPSFLLYVSTILSLKLLSLLPLSVSSLPCLALLQVISLKRSGAGEEWKGEELWHVNHAHQGAKILKSFFSPDSTRVVTCSESQHKVSPAMHVQ